MVLLDTCVLIFDALTPDQVSAPATAVIEAADRGAALACSDISLWEIAMLVRKGRLDPGADCLDFIHAALEARQLRVLPITPEIADLSTQLASVRQLDPTDRIIAATAVVHGATLLTSDRGLRNAQEVRTVW